MRHGSIAGPVILILIGGVFLLNNIRPEFSIWRMFAEYWPFVLIAWGALRLIEITALHLRGRVLPQQGISGGEWLLIILICAMGSTAFLGYRVREHFPGPDVFGRRGLELLGESYDFPVPAVSQPYLSARRIVVDNSRGNVRLIGADTDRVSVAGHSSVRAFSRDDAERTGKDIKVELVRQGDSLIVRSNNGSDSRKVSTDLEVTVPKGASVEGRGRYGDFDINDIAGPIVIDSENAGVRISNVQNSVRVETRRSDIIRIVNCKGAVELKGAGSDIQLENIDGQTTINGSYSGELGFRNLSKPIKYESSSTELRVEKINGHLQLTRGDLTGEDVTGPVFLKSRSKDVEIANFTSTMEIVVERGDIDLRPAKGQLSKLTANTKAGNITLVMPPAAQFRLRAETERGEIDNEISGSFQESNKGNHRRRSLEGSSGNGPEIALHTGRGQISLRNVDGAPLPIKPPKPPSPPAPNRSEF